MTNLAEQRQVLYVDAMVPEIRRKRVAAYCRVSSDSTEQLHSFSAQIKYYTDLINSHSDWELVDIYADEGITGVSRKKRDEFNRMIDDCNRGRIDHIITKSISRFARNNLDTIEVVRQLKEIGVSVLFEGDNMDTGKLTSEYLLAIKATFAQQESMNISQNVKKGHRAKMANGTFVTPHVPFGYIEENQVMKINPPEAEIVKEIFQACLNGIGVKQIARDLTFKNAIRPKGDSQWNSSSILFMLKNEKYIGDMLCQKTFSADDITYKTTRNHGQLAQFYIKNTHDAIIDIATFEQVQKLLQKRKISSGKESSVKEVLFKKIQCAKCRTTYRRKVIRGKVSWVCRRFDDGDSNCQVRLPEPAIFDAFIKMYQVLKFNDKVILQPIIKMLEQLSDIRQKKNLPLREINNQIGELHRQRQLLTDLMSSGVLDNTIFISQSDDLGRQLQALKLEKKRVVDDSEDNTLQHKTELLCHIIEQGPDQMTELDETIFNDIVDKIIAVDRHTIQFVLINGLVITEEIL